ncbi:TPA: hypothetical protein ACHD77_001840, partial [Campylobacter jejuni]
SLFLRYSCLNVSSILSNSSGLLPLVSPKKAWVEVDLLYAFTQSLKKIIHLYFYIFSSLFHKFFCAYLWFVIK